MPYISRNEKGEIVTLHKSPVEGSTQWVEESDPEVVAFVKHQMEASDRAMQVLMGTDTEMVRVVEDLIDILLEKQIFTFTELPEAVQAKLNTRKQLRRDMTSLEGLIIDDDGIF